MRLRFFIPLVAGSLYLLLGLVSCYSNRRPMVITNDIGEEIRVDISPYKRLDQPKILLIKSGDVFDAQNCSKRWEFIYLSTKSHPDFVAYRIKDMCDIDDCSCEIKVSDLERRRHDLSVPWAEAGSVFPPGALR